MKTKFLVLMLFALTVMVAPSWAAAASCNSRVDNFITCHFNPSVNTATFDFGIDPGDGVISVQFDSVLTTFDLTVTVNEVSSVPTSGDLANATCIPYTSNGFQCVRYDFSGTALPGGPNGEPVKGVDFLGLASLTLSYVSNSLDGIPAFGHAPGLNSATTAFTDNILTSYVDENAPGCSNCDGPGMGGKTPSLSPFAALALPFDPSIPNGESVCSTPGVQATFQNTTSGKNPIVEVSFKLVADDNGNFNGACPGPNTPGTGPFVRDKTATLSVAQITNHIVSFTNLVNGGAANKFHFDNKTGLNIQDINTNGLLSGTYFVTVMSDVFAPVTAKFIIP